MSNLSFHAHRALCWFLISLLAAPVAAFAQHAPPAVANSDALPPAKESIAVLNLDSVGANRLGVLAFSDRLREELIKGGKFTVVDRAHTDQVMREQAFQQESCATPACAVKAGKLLGARKLLTGTITELDDSHWQVSVTVVDVQSGETTLAESILHEGQFFGLLQSGAKRLAALIDGEKPDIQALVAAAPPPPPPATNPAASEPEQKSSHLWWWIAGGAVVAAIALGSSSSKGSGGGGGGGCGTCGKVTSAW